MKGNTGRILWVDLTTGLTKEEDLDESIYHAYISGIGLAANILYRTIPKGADPLGPENILAFTPGVLAATGCLFGGRWMASAKSPLTGTWGDSNCGGNLAPAIKQAGYDGIFFTGISARPVYVFIHNGMVEIKSAEHLWGKDAIETEDALTREIGGTRKPAVASIGMAGEKLSLIAGIVNDHGRMAARSGLGAVMGSKRLKAVVIIGNGLCDVADRETIKQLNNPVADQTRPKMKLPSGTITALAGPIQRWLPVQVRWDGLWAIPLFKKWGTSSMNRISIGMGDTPVKNWLGADQDYPLAASAAVDPDKIRVMEKKKYHCQSCPLGCGGILDTGGPLSDTHKPEYETASGFGALILNTDLDVIYRVNDALNRAGMDSISAASTAAFAIECFQNGWLTCQDTGGIELNWGDGKAVETLIHRMIHREGIGDLLADGSEKAAARIGNGSEQAAVTAGGQELGFHDPRFDPGYALFSTTDPTPGRHTTGSQAYYELYRLWEVYRDLPHPPPLYDKNRKFMPDGENARAAAATSCFTWLYSSAGICQFGANMGLGRIHIFEWINAATGWHKTPEDYLEAGRRVQTLRQLFNIKHGIDPRDIRVKPRALGYPPLLRGGNRGRTLDLDAMRSAYWKEIGWDVETGKPTPQSLQDLSLQDLVDQYG